MASVEADKIPAQATAARIKASWTTIPPDVQVAGLEKTIPILRPKKKHEQPPTEKGKEITKDSKPAIQTPVQTGPPLEKPDREEK